MLQMQQLCRARNCDKTKQIWKWLSEWKITITRRLRYYGLMFCNLYLFLCLHFDIKSERLLRSCCRFPVKISSFSAKHSWHDLEPMRCGKAWHTILQVVVKFLPRSLHFQMYFVSYVSLIWCWCLNECLWVNQSVLNSVEQHPIYFREVLSTRTVAYCCALLPQCVTEYNMFTSNYHTDSTCKFVSYSNSTRTSYCY